MVVLAAGCAQNQLADETEKAVEGPVSSQSIALSLAALPEEPGQPLNKAFSAYFVNGKVVSSSVTDLSVPTIMDPPPGVAAKPSAAPSQPPARISSRLSADIDRLGAQGQDPTVRVAVTFVQDRQLPRFPHRDSAQPLDSPANTDAQARADALVAAIKDARAPGYDGVSKQLATRHGAKEIERFWLINAMVVDVALSQIPALAARSDVQYVEYDENAIAPARSNRHMYDGRWLIGDVPWDSYVADAGLIGMLDSGVRVSHTLLSNPNMINRYRDCVNGTDSGCTVGPGFNPDDDCQNHGTAVASIISANSNLGSLQRGTSQILVDSWKVLAAGCGNGPVAAGVKAFSAAATVGDSVINASLWTVDSATGAQSVAANAAYDMGSVVVAAAGNLGCPPPPAACPNYFSVTSPGNATKVLAIGAVDVITQSLQDYSGRGPTADGRIKPDLTAPTGVWAANTASSTALYSSSPYFNGTSAAAPYAAAAAGRVRNVLFNNSGVWSNAGQIYAFMIAAGNQPSFNNDVGAGLIKLPDLSQAGIAWTATSLANHAFSSWGVNVGFTPSQVDVAIWWPDPTGGHNDIDIVKLIRPDGTVAGQSQSGGSVFEKVQATTGLTSGTWVVQTYGFNVTGSQTVYLAFIVR
jgi:serine protease AprX